MMFFGMFFWIILIIAAVMLFGSFFVNNTQKRSKPVLNRETPLDALKKRYARGELTKEEFERMKQEIQ